MIPHKPRTTDASRSNIQHNQHTTVSHISVLLQEVIESLHPTLGGVFVDATFGGGGHSSHIAEKIGAHGRLISFDADSTVFSEERVSALAGVTRFTPVNANFRLIGSELDRLEVGSVDGAVFDLGLSSTQLEVSGRGFSFQRDEPLAMTFSASPETETVTAASILNLWGADTIETVLRGFGEERFARRIAHAIVEARKVVPFVTTGQLTEVIRQSTPPVYHHGRTHFATRTFQALRMAVNDELGAIEAGISGVLPHLAVGGRIAVISFHSIEDRAVKQLFKKLESEGTVRNIYKKPVVPSASELQANPRSRSAKLRVVEKI